jgi:hypothetical protein
LNNKNLSIVISILFAFQIRNATTPNQSRYYPPQLSHSLLHFLSSFSLSSSFAEQADLNSIAATVRNKSRLGLSRKLPKAAREQRTVDQQEQQDQINEQHHQQQQTFQQHFCVTFTSGHAEGADDTAQQQQRPQVLLHKILYIISVRNGISTKDTVFLFIYHFQSCADKV